MRVLIDAASANDMIVVHPCAALLVLTDALAAVRTTATALLIRSAVLVAALPLTTARDVQALLVCVDIYLLRTAVNVRSDEGTVAVPALDVRQPLPLPFITLLVPLRM